MRDDAAAGGLVRALHEERDADLLIIERLAVPIAAVLHELLAVIGGDDNRHLVVEAALFERLDELTEMPIPVGDLAVVELSKARGLLGGRRRVRRARISRTAVRMLKIGIVRIHIGEEEEEGSVLLLQLVEMGDGDGVHIFGIDIGLARPLTKKSPCDALDDLEREQSHPRFIGSEGAPRLEILIVIKALVEVVPG